ncbi:hypothetical protein [Brevibacillus sp. HD1.4A]|uniref:hypothetical protein n=1 Tax=Brevibacillus sp. HD1.4A TaxID=2738978 RepID=UPI001C2B87B3|nr:hypothetical protein [Brevibacillus sp. HD1.4A]
MNKSFYYLIIWSEQKELKRELVKLKVPFTFESANGQCAVVFPDLPVRKYAEVRKLFKGDGLPYPS